jgi:D-aspartate ligase
MQSTFACVLGGLSIVRALGREGIPVACVVTPDKKDRTSLSRYVRRTVFAPSASADAAGLLTELRRFGHALGEPPVLFVDNDGDLLFVSRNRESLSESFRLLLPPADLLEDLVDKRRFAALARRANLPTPKTHVIARGCATRDPEVRAWDAFPCLLKPGLRMHWFGSRLGDRVISTQKAVRVDSRDELLALASGLDAHPSDFILQPLIEGGEEQIVSYHAYVSDAGVIADFTGRKVRTVPPEYGFSSCIQITDDDRVRRIGRDVLARIGFRGVVKLDFKEDLRDGGLYLLEANPRVNLWQHLGAVAGVNLPALAYRDLVNPGSVRPIEHHARPGVRWMWALPDLAQQRSSRTVPHLRWLHEVVTAGVVEDLCWSDPLPAIAGLFGRLHERTASMRRSRQSSAPEAAPGLRLGAVKSSHARGLRARLRPTGRGRRDDRPTDAAAVALRDHRPPIRTELE